MALPAREGFFCAIHAENTTIRAVFIYILRIFLVSLYQMRLILQKTNRPKEDGL